MRVCLLMGEKRKSVPGGGGNGVVWRTGKDRKYSMCSRIEKRVSKHNA